jgi:hypothetical protein
MLPLAAAPPCPWRSSTQRQANAFSSTFASLRRALLQSCFVRRCSGLRLVLSVRPRFPGRRVLCQLFPDDALYADNCAAIRLFPCVLNYLLRVAASRAELDLAISSRAAACQVRLQYVRLRVVAMTSRTCRLSASCSPPSPVSSRVHAHVTDAMPYQHATAKLAALLHFFSASCRGTPAVGPIRLQNVVPELLPDDHARLRLQLIFSTVRLTSTF